MIARLPMGAVGLLLVLQTHALTGSYGRGGLAAGVYALALGVSNPLLARVSDRRGQTALLRTGAAVSSGATLAIALLPEAAPFAVLLGCALVGGAAQPPIGACMRALWPQIVPDPSRRHAAFALEATVLEVVYICGPLVIVAGIGAWSLRAALAACAVALLAGNLLFAAQRASREWRPVSDDVGRDVFGALRAPGVRVLVVVFALCGLAVGAIEVAVPASLTEMGHKGLTGVVLGVWGVGSMLAGLAVARTGPAADPVGRLTTLLAAWGVTHAAVALATTPAVLALTLLAAGATIAPTFVCVNGMLDALAPAGTITEAFTWTSTGLVAGVALGSALGGAITDHVTPAAALAILGGGGLLAALTVRAAAGGPFTAAN